MPKRAIFTKIKVGDDVVKGSGTIKFPGIILDEELKHEKIHSS